MKKSTLLMLMTALLLNFLGCGPKKATDGEINTAESDAIFQNDNLEKKTIDPQKISDFETAFANKFDPKVYESIDPKLLAHMVLGVPKQGTNHWACGYIGSWHALANVRLLAKKDAYYPIDLTKPGAYPFAFEAQTPINGEVVNVLSRAGVNLPSGLDLSGLVQTMNKVGRNDGFFRVGSLPINMVKYLNQRMPKGFEASYQASDVLDEAALMLKISTAIADNLPVFVVVRPSINSTKFEDKVVLHYYNIVGMKNDNTEVIILDSNPDSVDRLHSLKIEELHKHLDISEFKKIIDPVVEKIGDVLEKGYSIIGGITVAGASIQAMLTNNGIKVAEPKDYRTLKNFNFITFKKK